MTFSGLLYALGIFAALTTSAAGSFDADVSAARGWQDARVKPYRGESIPGRYIVKLKRHVTEFQLPASAYPDLKQVWSASLDFNGFAGNFNDQAIEELLNSPGVDYIEEDGIVRIASSNVFVSQTDAPWGLARISQDAKLANQNTSALFTYKYGANAGQGTDIYILDTGVFVEHSDFGGRARWGATFGNYSNTDGNGHGTHCAGTAAGTRFGVAKLANIISVKVLSDQGAGTISDIISGLNWIIQSAQASGRPSVVLMAIGGSASVAMDNAVTAVTNAGIHVAVSAGNSASDVSNFSPARVPSAITVGACSIADAMSSGSNTGSLLDLFAPGVNILSDWIGSPTATNTISGSSSSAAHVAGLIAYLLSILGASTPAVMSNTLATIAVKGALSGVPIGTANLLASNNVTRIGVIIMSRG